MKIVKRFALRLDYSGTYVMSEDDMLRLCHILQRSLKIELPAGQYRGTYHPCEDQDKLVLSSIEIVDLQIEDDQEELLPKAVSYSVDARGLP